MLARFLDIPSLSSGDARGQLKTAGNCQAHCPITSPGSHWQSEAGTTVWFRRAHISGDPVRSAGAVPGGQTLEEAPKRWY